MMEGLDEGTVKPGQREGRNMNRNQEPLENQSFQTGFLSLKQNEALGQSTEEEERDGIREKGGG